MSSPGDGSVRSVISGVPTTSADAGQLPFSKPSEQMTSTQTKPSLPDILVDSREPAEIIEAIRMVLKDKIISVEALPTDYLIPPSETQPGWAIERKHRQDFVHTWLGNRLPDQLKALKHLEETGEYRAALMIVGNPIASQRRKNGKSAGPNQLATQNMLNSVTAKWGIHVLPVYSDWQMPMTLKYLVDSMDGKKASFNPRVGASRDDPPEEQARYVASGFPGCGPKTLDKVRQETTDLVSFITKCLNANVDCLTDNQMSKINQVLTANWRLSEHEQNRESRVQ